jgi:hypothetical protein
MSVYCRAEYSPNDDLLEQEFMLKGRWFQRKDLEVICLLQSAAKRLIETLGLSTSFCVLVILLYSWLT